MIEWLINGLIGRLTDWLVNWLTDWFLFVTEMEALGQMLVVTRLMWKIRPWSALVIISQTSQSWCKSKNLRYVWKSYLYKFTEKRHQLPLSSLNARKWTLPTFNWLIVKITPKALEEPKKRQKRRQNVISESMINHEKI